MESGSAPASGAANGALAVGIPAPGAPLDVLSFGYRVIAKRNFRNGGRRPAGRRGKPAGLPHHFGNYFWQPVYHHCTAALPPHEPRGTSNIEPPTPNIEWQRESSLTSAFGVRGWTFDVFPRFSGSMREIFLSPHPMRGEGRVRGTLDIRQAV